MTTSMGPATGGSVARGSGLRAAIVVAAAGSAGAGLVHAAAAGSHGDSGTLVWLFSLCAAAQLGWAAAVVAAPTRAVLLLGAGINGAAVVTWFFTRTTGIPFVGALEEAEAVSTPDLVAAALGAMAVAGAVTALVMPIARRTMPGAWSAMVVIGTVALVVPAMAADHGHGGEGHAHLASEEVHAGGEAHDHDDGGSKGGHHDGDASADHHDEDDDSNHDDADHDDGDHAHPASTGGSRSDDDDHHADGRHDDDHPHGGNQTPGPNSSGGNNHGGHNDDDGHHSSGPPSSPNTPPHNHQPPASNQPPHNHQPPTSNQPPHNHPPTPTPTGPIVSLDDPRLSAAQRNAGSQLLVRTLEGMRPFPTVDAVVAAGYRSIGDAGTGFEHFVNWTYFNDGIELDPGRIESIVIKVGPNGAKTVASGMYILNLGKGMGDVPEIAGPLTTWHDHKNLCWVPNGEGGMRLSGVTDANGNCARGQNIVTPPMLHVWLTPQPCGPFSGIEGIHGEACAHGH
jgi:hypothetical protein